MNTYEVSWQFEQGDAEWADSFLYDAENIEELGKLLRSIKNDRDKDDYTDMSVIFAQIMNDDIDDADERDITDELPEDILAD
jgi:hypothetical protein